MRSIGLDIHRDFAEVAIAESGEVRSPGRIEKTPEALELFAQSLGRTDQVALEVSGNAWEVARIIRPHVARLVVLSPADTGIRAAGPGSNRSSCPTRSRRPSRAVCGSSTSASKRSPRLSSGSQRRRWGHRRFAG